MPDTLREIGRRVRTLREAAGLSLDDVSEATNHNKGTLSGLETGKTGNPGIATLIGIADALGVPVTAFLDDGQFRASMQVVFNRRYAEVFSTEDEQSATAGFSAPHDRVTVPA